MERIKLEIKSTPVPLSFITFEKHIIVDPSAEEESLSQSHFTVTYNDKGQFCGVNKLGGEVIDSLSLKASMKIAMRRAVELKQLLQNQSTN